MTDFSLPCSPADPFLDAYAEVDTRVDAEAAKAGVSEAEAKILCTVSTTFFSANASIIWFSTPGGTSTLTRNCILNLVASRRAMLAAVSSRGFPSNVLDTDGWPGRDTGMAMAKSPNVPAAIELPSAPDGPPDPTATPPPLPCWNELPGEETQIQAELIISIT